MFDLDPRPHHLSVGMTKLENIDGGHREIECFRISRMPVDLRTVANLTGRHQHHV